MQLTSCFILLLASGVHCSYLKRAIQHSLPGKSVGRVAGVETYEYEGHQYSFHLEPRTWEDAVGVCRREGGYLAVLEDAFEIDFVGHAMDGNLCSNTVLQNVWIGARLFPEAGRWLWDTTGYEVIGGGPDSPKPDRMDFPPWDLTHKPGHDCLYLHQDLTHRPKFTNLECHRKRRFLCEKGCPKLYDTDRGFWHPDSCLLDPAATGDRCRLVCHSGLELDGANPLTCARGGWNNTIGINVIPDCKGPEEMANDLVEELHHALDNENTFLIFVVDEAVHPAVFKAEIALIEQLILMFPPSDSHQVTVVGNGETARVLVHAGGTTCAILDQLSSLPYSGARGGDLGVALQAAMQLLPNPSSEQPRKPILLVVSGNAGTGPGSRQAAAALKAASAVVFTLGVGNFDSDELIAVATTTIDGPLFFGLTDPANFNKLNQRLQTFGSSAGGSCRASADAVAMFVETLQTSLTNNSSLLFLLDHSSHRSAEFVNMSRALIEAVVTAFPLSRARQAGLVTVSPRAKLAIPLRAEGTCAFIRHLQRVDLAPAASLDDKEDAGALACLEVRRGNPHGHTVAVIVSSQRSPAMELALREAFVAIVAVEITDAALANGTLQPNKLHTRRRSADGPNVRLEISSSESFQDTVSFLGQVDRPHNEDCSKACGSLPVDERGTWDCVGPGRPGTRCHLVCGEAFELVGSNPLVCSERGWTGTAGDDVIPTCMAPEEIAAKFMDKLQDTLGNAIDSNLLFVLDESGSVTLPNFIMEVDFVASVVDAFPLSERRRAGLALFSDKVRVVIAVTASETCRFIRASRRVRYRGGQTDIHKALTKARDEIHARAVHPQTLVFLVTDGISQTDPLEAALALRADGAVLFVIGVADYQQEQLEPLASLGPDGTTNFFGVKSFRVFHVIAEYLNQTYRVEGVNCT